MIDYFVLTGLIIFLVIYFWLDKKNLKGFFWKDTYEQFNALRLYFILIMAIIALIIKILKPV